MQDQDRQMAIQNDNGRIRALGHEEACFLWLREPQRNKVARESPVYSGGNVQRLCSAEADCIAKDHQDDFKQRL